MRIGLEKSRNLMTVRLASNIGMRRVREIAKPSISTTVCPATVDGAWRR